MQLDDPFPLEYFPPRVRTAILAEFHGRHPTIRDVVRLPDTYWLKVPTMGPATLAKLRDLTRSLCSKSHTSPLARMSEEELLAQRSALQGELKRIREELRANTAELRMRGISPDSRRFTYHSRVGFRSRSRDNYRMASGL